MPKPRIGGVKKPSLTDSGVGGKFLGQDPADTTVGWSESQIQMFIITQSFRNGVLITGCMEQGLRSKSAGGKAKAMGMTAGMPDMLCWLTNGKIIGIELKTKIGKLSDVQKEFHNRLLNLGHNVFTVYADCPFNGWQQIKEILKI